MRTRGTSLCCVASVAAIVAGAALSNAAVAGTYANITVQGEPAGTEFNDWVGIPVLAMDPVDNPGGSPDPFIDIKDVQIANNDDFLFVHISYHNSSSVGTLIAIDNDQNTATGFNIFGLGVIGSEIGYINDFPFAQATGVFNTNVALTGGPIGNGGALIFPFWDQNGPDKELAIPRDLMVTFPAAPGFPNPSIDIAIYTDQGLADITDVISYTFAEAPSLDGDYNLDGKVDAADYVVWRETEGSPAAYDLWAANFGKPDSAAAGGGAGLSTGSAAVPEPGSGILFTVMMAALNGIYRGCSRVVSGEIRGR